MLKGEPSAILSIFIKLPFVIKIFVLSIFEWPLRTGLTVLLNHLPWVSETITAKTNDAIRRIINLFMLD